MGVPWVIHACNPAGDMSLSAGSRLGPYQILSLIGVGGMGEVYKARDTRLDRPSRSSCSMPSSRNGPTVARDSKRKRAPSPAQPSAHLHALRRRGSGRRAFLVMEYLEGETLDDRLTRGPLPPNEVLRYALEIAGALDHAHRDTSSIAM